MCFLVDHKSMIRDQNNCCRFRFYGLCRFLGSTCICWILLDWVVLLHSLRQNVPHQHSWWIGDMELCLVVLQYLVLHFSLLAIWINAETFSWTWYNIYFHVLSLGYFCTYFLRLNQTSEGKNRFSDVWSISSSRYGVDSLECKSCIMRISALGNPSFFHLGKTPFRRMNE